MLSVLWPHDFILVSHLSPTYLPISSGCSEFASRMILYLSSICLPALISHLSPFSLVLWLASPLSLPVSNTLWVLWLHAFALVSHLSLLVSNNLWVLWLHAFALVSLWVFWAAWDVSSAYSRYTWPDVCFYTCLPWSPTFSAYFGLHLADCLSSCFYAFGWMSLHFSPCLSPFLLHLSPLVPACSGYAFTLVSACLFACSLLRHSWPSGFTLSHLSPCSSPFLLHLSPLVPVLASLLHLSPFLCPCLSHILVESFQHLLAKQSW